VRGDAKQRAYLEADLFVLPTYSENFGLTVAEALASGTPVIVSKGAPWAGIETEEAGWWCEIGLDPLVSVLETAFSQSTSDLRAMGEHGRDWVKREFDWNRIGRRILEVYRWLLGSTSGPPDDVRID